MHNQETSQAPLHSRDPGSLDATGGVTLKIMPFTVGFFGFNLPPNIGSLAVIIPVVIRDGHGWTTSILGSPAVASAEHLSERALQCDFLRGLWHGDYPLDPLVIKHGDVGNPWKSSINGGINGTMPL